MASDGCMCTTLTVSQQTCSNLQHECKLLNKGKLRSIFVFLGSPLAINAAFEWAFWHISSVKCPTPKRLQMLRTSEVHLLALALIKIRTGDNGSGHESQAYVISVTPRLAQPLRPLSCIFVCVASENPC